MKVGINVKVGIRPSWNKHEGWDFWEKFSKRGVEGATKSKKPINVEGGNVSRGRIFFQISKCDFTFIREMRVCTTYFSILPCLLISVPV